MWQVLGQPPGWSDDEVRARGQMRGRQRATHDGGASSARPYTDSVPAAARYDHKLTMPKIETTSTQQVRERWAAIVLAALQLPVPVLYVLCWV